MFGNGLVIAGALFDEADVAPAAGVDLRERIGASFQP